MRKDHNNEIIAFKIYLWVIGVLGSISFVWTIYQTNFNQLGFNFVLLAVVTIALSSRTVVDIPQLKSNISLADVFLFLTALLFGLDAMILLATVEAYITTFRLTQKTSIRIFNAGVMACSLFVAAKVSLYFFSNIQSLQDNELTYNSLFALGTLAFVHFLVNTSIVSGANWFRSENSLWSIWKESYLWMSVTVLASASIALVIMIAIQNIGLFALILAMPIIGIIYFSYRSYLGKIEISELQTEQAKTHLLEMQASEERFRGAFGQAPIGMALLSTEGKFLQVNLVFLKIIGYTEEELINDTFHKVFHREDIVFFLSQIGKILQNRAESFQNELRLFHRDGFEIWTSINVSVINFDLDKTTQLIFQVEDITDRRNAEHKLFQAAFYDSLTGLANRALFLEKLGNEITKAKKTKKYSFAIVFMDLDRFKVINDSMGHLVGDELLKLVGQRLTDCIPANHLIARLSGDEFIILLRNVSYEDEVIRIVEKIQDQLSAKYNLRGHEVFVNASIGISIFNDSDYGSKDLLRDADIALHEAKAQGKGRYLLFDEKMHSKVANQLEIETDLQSAVEENQLFLVYQPIVSLETQRLAGFEALIRWQHPEKGLVNPSDFISIAEETGEIIRIGKFVIEEACNQLKKWESKFECSFPITISVNVSAKQFMRGDLFETVIKILEETKIKPSQLKLEITESVIIEDIETTISILKKFRILGIEISMDDFGTGFSSLSYLHQLPITTLKVDRSFVSKMDHSKENLEIVNTILLLAEKLGLDVIAEGIENEAQLDKLKEFGCSYGQGYYFGKPLSTTDATNYLETLRQQLIAIETGSNNLIYANQTKIPDSVIEIQNTNF